MAEVISLNSASEEDEGYAAFIESLREGNKSAVFIVRKDDGTLSIGSTAQDAKELVWDIAQLQMFMQSIVKGEM